MKKQLLATLAAMGAFVAFAAIPTPEVVDLETAVDDGSLIVPVEATAAPESWEVGKGVLKVPSSKVQYLCPPGTYFGSMLKFDPNVALSSTVSYYPGGMLKLVPFNTAKFVALNPDETPVWNTYSRAYDENNSLIFVADPEVEADTFEVEYGSIYTRAPRMAIGDYDFGATAYQFSNNVNTECNIYALAVANTTVSYGSVIPVAGGWAGFTNRQGGKAYQTWVSGKDDDGKQFAWMGSGSPYDATAALFRAPEKPYVAEAVYLFGSGTVLAPTELKVEVWEVLKGEYTKDSLVMEADSTEVLKTYYYAPTLGEKLADGVAKIDTLGISGGQFYGLIKAPFEIEDEWGKYEYGLEVDKAIMVMVTGYADNENLKDFHFLVNTDDYNDGLGSAAYLGYSVNATTGKPWLRGLLYAFSTLKFPASTGIYLDVTTPYFMTYYTNMPDSIHMEADGGPVEFKIKVKDSEGNVEEKTVPVQLYSYTPYMDGEQQNWFVTTEDGEELPDWLTVECSDNTKVNTAGEEEYNHVTDVLINVDPLPADVKGRKVTIKFAYPAASYLFTVVQGEDPGPGDGIEGVTTDGNVVGTEIFNLQGQRVSSANAAHGLFIVKSINADGTATATKVVR